MVGAEGIIWKFVTLDCWKMYLPKPELLKMSLKNSSTTTDIFVKSHDVVLQLHENRKQTLLPYNGL